MNFSADFSSCLASLSIYAKSAKNTDIGDPCIHNTYAKNSYIKSTNSKGICIAGTYNTTYIRDTCNSTYIRKTYISDLDAVKCSKM